MYMVFYAINFSLYCQFSCNQKEHLNNETFYTLLAPICILYCKHCNMMNNIEYVGFLDLGFQGKNLYVMFVFSIVSFLFFSEYLFTVDIVQG